MMSQKILIGHKGPEPKYKSIMGPWMLIDYWPYIVGGVIYNHKKASEVAIKFNCILPKQTHNG